MAEPFSMKDQAKLIVKHIDDLKYEIATLRLEIHQENFKLEIMNCKNLLDKIFLHESKLNFLEESIKSNKFLSDRLVQNSEYLISLSRIELSLSEVVIEIFDTFFIFKDLKKEEELELK